MITQLRCMYVHKHTILFVTRRAHSARDKAKDNKANDNTRYEEAKWKHTRIKRNIKRELKKEKHNRTKLMK